MADLIESREGINMTYSELKALADVIVPLVKKGHSPYQIITSHPELNISEKTLYNYIESGVFRQFGLLDIDLRVKTRRISKKDWSIKRRPEILNSMDLYGFSFRNSKRADLGPLFCGIFSLQ